MLSGARERCAYRWIDRLFKTTTLTGDDYLQLSLDAVQQLVDDTRVLQLKEKRCGLLTIELLKVAISVRAAVDRLPTEKQACVGNRHEFASQELYRWVTESAAIINSCRAEDAVKKAVELHDTTEMFIEAILKLRWCGAVLESVILNAANNTTRSDLQRSATDIFVSYLWWLKMFNTMDFTHSKTINIFED